ncbi:MAG: hypothetical protein M0R73_01690 [Dehalococcoidia bacterium]|nr:hypothetical protein [Dehalococcoidia bacterium]
MTRPPVLQTPITQTPITQTPLAQPLPPSLPSDERPDDALRSPIPFRRPGAQTIVLHARGFRAQGELLRFAALVERNGAFSEVALTRVTDSEAWFTLSALSVEDVVDAVAAFEGFDLHVRSDQRLVEVDIRAEAPAVNEGETLLPPRPRFRVFRAPEAAPAQPAPPHPAQPQTAQPQTVQPHAVQSQTVQSQTIQPQAAPPPVAPAPPLAQAAPHAPLSRPQSQPASQPAQQPAQRPAAHTPPGVPASAVPPPASGPRRPPAASVPAPPFATPPQSVAPRPAAPPPPPRYEYDEDEQVVAPEERPGGAVSTVEHMTLVVYPFHSFAALNDFQAAVRTLHGITNTRVRRFYRGTLHLAVDYEDIIPLGERIRDLKAFDFEVASESRSEIELVLADSGSLAAAGDK